MTVLAANDWPTNADLIADVAALYIGDDDRVLDATYGRGRWWTSYRPRHLQTNDANPERGANFRFDFRDFPPSWGSMFDVVAYDPPYVCVGGRKTTGLPDMHDAYGLTDAPTSPAKLQDMIDAGLDEVHRVLRPGGLALVKVQDYVSSGKLWIGTHHTLTHALALGFECIDRMEHYGAPRPQPGGRRQVHARRNLSTLFVLRKGKP